MATTRAYALHGYLGLVEQRRARSTGTLVGLYQGEQAGMDTDGGLWQTVCEVHGGIASHVTLALARWHMASPEGWCEECMAERCTCSPAERIVADNDPANGTTAERIVRMTEGTCNGCRKARP